MHRKPGASKDKLITHAMLFVACVLFPACLTAIAPVSWATLTRHGERVEARVKVCLFFIIPYRTLELTQVTSVDHHVRAGVRERLDIDSSDRNREVTTESEGSLVLHGPGEEKVVVQVSPASLEEIARDVRDFLADQNRAEHHFFAPANWKVSIIVGGAVCLLTLLYLIVLVSALWYRIISGRRELNPTRRGY